MRKKSTTGNKNPDEIYESRIVIRMERLTVRTASDVEMRKPFLTLKR